MIASSIKIVPFLGQVNIGSLHNSHRYTALISPKESFLFRDSLPFYQQFFHDCLIITLPKNTVLSVCASIASASMISGAPPLGALDFRHGGRAPWWCGCGKHRPLTGSATTKPSVDASMTPPEVQRPVFLAIAVIVTAYLPIFVRRVEGRCICSGPSLGPFIVALAGALRSRC